MMCFRSVDILLFSGPEVIKLLSCSTQLNMKVKVLILTEITKIGCNFRLILPKAVICCKQCLAF